MTDYLYFRNDLHGAHQLPLEAGDIVELKITRENKTRTVELELSKGGFDVNYDVDGLLKGGGPDTRLDWDQSGAIKPTVYMEEHTLPLPAVEQAFGLPSFKPSVSEILGHEHLILNDGSPQDNSFRVEDDILSNGKEREYKNLDESGIIETPDSDDHLDDLMTFNDEMHEVEQGEIAEDKDAVAESESIETEEVAEEDEPSGVKSYDDDLFSPFGNDDGYDEIESP